MATKISGTLGVDRVQDDTLVVVDAKAGQAVGFNRMQLFAAKAATGGTSVDFSPADGTGIPSWAKRVTVMFDQLSTNGASNKLLRLGTSIGVVVANYRGCTTNFTASTLGSAQVTDGFEIGGTNATDIINGSIVLTKLTDHIWTVSGYAGYSSGTAASICGGSRTFAIPLDRIRLTTRNGTDTFDSGSVSILVEGYE